MKTTNGYGNDYHGYNGCFVLYYSFSIMIFVLKFCILAFSDEIVYANSADPDETAPLGAVSSGSTLFAITQSIS